MTTAIGDGAVGLAIICVLLIVFLVASRARGRALRRRDGAVRESAIASIAGYLAGEPEPAVPVRPRARRTFAQACLDVVVELRGGERERVTDLFVRTGLLADTAATLRSRRHTSRRRRAADALALLAHPEGREPLRAGLRDRDADVRAACSRGLAALGDPDALTYLERGDTGTRDTMDVLLVAATTRPAVLESAFTSPTARIQAAEVAGALRLVEHAAALRSALGAGEPELALAAARALGRIGDFEAVAPLAALAADVDTVTSVRIVAVQALGEIGDPAAVPVLERVLRAEGYGSAVAAAEAMARLGESGRAALARTRGSSGLPSDLARAALDG